MSHRHAVRALMLFGFAGLTAAPATLGQQAPLDKVHFRDHSAGGTVATVDAEIKESAAGVQLLTGKKGVISPADVIRIDYGDVKGIAKGDHYAALAAEDGRDPAKAQSSYADLLKKAGPSAPEKTRRYLAFREAVWSGRVADSKTGEEFRAEAPKAAEKLAAFARATKQSWEVWPTARAAARLYTELGEHAQAAALLGELASVADLPRELRFEARLAEATAILRSGQLPPAEVLLDQIEKDKEFPATGPLQDRLTVLRAAAKALAEQSGTMVEGLEVAVAQVKDPVAKAIGSNFLGDVYAAAGRPRDAMWSYLWVDVVFNQDRDEQVYAVSQLVGVFEKLGDTERAGQFRERLPRVR
jgi:hypothetical protein